MMKSHSYTSITCSTLSSYYFNYFLNVFSVQNLPPHLGGTCASYGPNPLEGGAVSTAPALVRSTHIVQAPVSASSEKDKDTVESKNFVHIVQLGVHSTESTVQGHNQGVSGGSIEQVNGQALVQERVSVVGIDVSVSGKGVGVGMGAGVAQSGSSSFRGSVGDISAEERETGRGREPQGVDNKAESRSERDKGQKASHQLAPSCLHLGSGDDQKVCSDNIEVVNRVSLSQNSMSGSNSSHDSAMSSSHMTGSIKFEDNAAENALDDWSSIWT
jgi:hypothetical protein